MIKVYLVGNRWALSLICAGGCRLVWSAETFDTNHAANDNAKAWRTTFWAHAAGVDHSMGAAL